MSVGETISIALDEINDAIFFNYGFLPVISLVIYLAWAGLLRRSVKSAWYISLGIPGSIAFILLLLACFFFYRYGSGPLIERIKLLLVTLICLPGYMAPTIALIYHIIKFSSTKPMMRSDYLLSIPIVLTYLVNAFMARYLADW